MSTRNLPWCKKRPVHTADNLTAAGISEKTNNIVSGYQISRNERNTDIEGKHVMVPDVPDRVRYNAWQRYFLLLMLTELNGHGSNNCEWAFKF
jgi:hypothetical protein